MAGRAPTLQVGHLTGTWASVYKARGAVEAAAERQALTAWRAVLGSVDVTDVVALAADEPPPPGDAETARLRRDHLQQVLSAAVLARLVLATRDPGWAAFTGVIATALATARDAGAKAGHAVADDSADGLDSASNSPVGAAEEVGAYTTAAQALRGLAAAVARTVLDAAASGDSAEQLQQRADQVLHDALALTAAVAAAVAVAYTAGLTGAYASRGVAQVAFITVGDTSVCKRCAAAEDNGPYPTGSAPQPPLHPNCRCGLEPA